MGGSDQTYTASPAESVTPAKSAAISERGVRKRALADSCTCMVRSAGWAASTGARQSFGGTHGDGNVRRWRACGAVEEMFGTFEAVHRGDEALWRLLVEENPVVPSSTISVAPPRL